MAGFFAQQPWYNIAITDFQDVPTSIWEPIVGLESGGDPNVVGDHGTSAGLLQLHINGGQGTGYTIDQLKDPATNLAIGAPPIVSAYHQGVGQGLSGFQLLNYVANTSGHPNYSGTKPLADRLYDATLDSRAYGMGYSSKNIGGSDSTQAPATTSGGGDVLQSLDSQLNAPPSGVFKVPYTSTLSRAGMVLLGIVLVAGAFMLMGRSS